VAHGKAGIRLHISWVYSEEIDSTAEFYSKALGLECIRETADSRIFATSENAAIGLCRVFDDRVVDPKGGMISFVSDDVDGWYRRLLDRGLTIDAPPRRMRQFGIYSFFVRDPNGYIIEFQQFD
jgi:catechol 2,3-dioxygenase-like lactoylglutathione lyase family enzyme